MTTIEDPAVTTVHSRRWWVLAVLGLSQLMIVLDTTVMNLALPSAQEALGFTDDNRQWVITAYAPAVLALLSTTFVTARSASARSGSSRRSRSPEPPPDSSWAARSPSTSRGARRCTST